MEEAGGGRDPRITNDLRVQTLTKLVQDLLRYHTSFNQTIDCHRLKSSACRFERDTFATATSKEHYLMIMTQRPVTSILPIRDYIISPNSGSVTQAARTGNEAAAINLGSSGIDLLQNTHNDRPTGLASGPHQASADFLVRQNNNSGRQQAQPTEHIIANILNPVLQAPPQPLPQPQPPPQPQAQQPQPHARLLQMRRHDQLRKQHAQNQSASSSHLMPARSSGGQTSQSGFVATEQERTSQQLGMPPNQLIRNHTLQQQELVQKSNANNHTLQQQELVQKSNANEQSSSSNSRQNQSSKNKGILESHIPAQTAGSRDFPIVVSESEDNTEWLNKAFQVIQKCKEDCLHVLSKLEIHFSRQSPQGHSEDTKMMLSSISSIMKFLHRSNMTHVSKQAFYSDIERIYKFAGDMRTKHPTLFPKHAEESRSTDSRAQQDVISPIQPLQPAVLEWEYDDIDVFDFYGIDILIDLGCHTLFRRPKRPRVEVAQGRLMEAHQSSTFNIHTST